MRGLQFPVPVASQIEGGRAHATVLRLVLSTAASAPTGDALSVNVRQGVVKTISSTSPDGDIQQVADQRLGAINLGRAPQISIGRVRQPAPRAWPVSSATLRPPHL
jgi:hypothetical protein